MTKQIYNYIVSGQDETGFRQVQFYEFAVNALREFDRMEEQGFRNIRFENISDQVQLVDGRYI